jgi:transposase
MTGTRRQFTPEFKLEAVRLVADSGKPLTQVARELGIRSDVLRAWKRKVEAGTGQPSTTIFPGSGTAAGPDAELQRLRRENEVLKQERDFLKKAAAYFAKESR